MIRIDLDSESFFIGIVVGMIITLSILLIVAKSINTGFTDKQLLQLNTVCTEVLK